MTPLRRLIVWPMILSLGAAAAAADWPQFRGPGGMGIAAKEKGVPTKWDDDTNLAWKVELPGPGASSPIVVGDRVLVTCYSGYGLPKGQVGDIANLKRHLLCFSRAGKPLWKKEFAAQGKEAPYAGTFITKHGYASSTPVSDGKHVFVYFGTTGVLAFDLDGNEKWRVSVGKEAHGWGSGSSPIVYKDLVIINAGIESGALVALQKENGKRAWTADGTSMSWATPAVVDAGKRKELVVNLPGHIRAFDPDSGNDLWSCKGTEDFYVVGEAIAQDGIVYAIGGRDNMACAVKTGSKGEVSPLWRINKGSNVGTPVFHDGHIYYSNEQSGIVYCVRAKDGKVAYDKRLEPEAGLIYASPTLADGKLYYVSREQGTYVVEVSPTFKLLAHNSLKKDTSVFNASPAIVDGKIYLRSDRFLYCIGK
jgi:outer membrane protein assembly factor BamB